MSYEGGASVTLTTETINNLIGIKESYQASDALMKILFDREKRVAEIKAKWAAEKEAQA